MKEFALHMRTSSRNTKPGLIEYVLVLVIIFLVGLILAKLFGPAVTAFIGSVIQNAQTQQP